MPAILNHFGHCVSDLERSIRFYSDLFGFEEKRRMDVPDSPADRLLRIEAPLGMTAAYLVKDGVTLELMVFDRGGNPSARERPLNEPGLTHMSFCVEDLPGVRQKVAQLGGEVLSDTDVGGPVFVRDPDGQLIELLPMEARRLLG